MICFGVTKEVGQIIATGKLAEPPRPEVCAFLCLRIHMAADVLNSFNNEGEAPPMIAVPQPLVQMEDSQVAEWLLIDFWHGLGKQMWQSFGYWEFDMWQHSHDEPRAERLSDDQIVT
jgi:hypothetical protein